jgi:dTDP-4-dehydrorhamnose 3,5-epimerase-like enzyme
LAFDDESLGIDWPFNSEAPITSEKDAKGLKFAQAPTF